VIPVGWPATCKRLATEIAWFLASEARFQVPTSQVAFAESSVCDRLKRLDEQEIAEELKANQAKKPRVSLLRRRTAVRPLPLC